MNRWSYSEDGELEGGADVDWEAVLEESFEGHDPIGRQFPGANLTGLLRAMSATQNFQGFQGPCFWEFMLLKKNKKHRKYSKEIYLASINHFLPNFCLVQMINDFP